MIRGFLTTLIALACCSAAHGADGLIELTVHGQLIQGKQVAHDRKKCWLADTEGRLTEISLDSVTAFRQINPKFAPIATMELRDRLRKELGSKFEVEIRGNYVVCAPPGRARLYADLLDKTSHEFESYFRVRKFSLTTVDYPLVAVVYPTKAEFFERCQADGVPTADTLRGYYHPQSNRILYFDDVADMSGQVAMQPPAPGKLSPVAVKRPGKGTPQDHYDAQAPIDALHRDTTVHEAIHQLAFNTGLHSRVGENPLWMVEGLAMQFEHGRPDGQALRSGKSGINLSRLQNFDNYRRERRQEGSLVQLISGEHLFRSAPVDAYSEAWMLTYYLIQTRPVKYGYYLQTLSARGAVADYSTEQRLLDFKSNFGEDLAWFEIEFLRFAEETAQKNLDSPKKGGKSGR
jgi:hypothetical protein